MSKYIVELTLTAQFSILDLFYDLGLPCGFYAQGILYGFRGYGLLISWHRFRVEQYLNTFVYLSMFLQKACLFKYLLV